MRKLKAWSFRLRKNDFCRLYYECARALQSSITFFYTPCIYRYCSEFKSGEVSNMLRSKGRNKLFDEKGVFGRVCRHEYPKGFISIKHGERLDVIM